MENTFVFYLFVACLFGYISKKCSDDLQGVLWQWIPGNGSHISHCLSPPQA